MDPYGGMDAMEAVAIALAFMGIFFLIFGGVMLVFYIFRSIALYRLAANRGMSAPGLAWIPVIGSFRIGAVADDIYKLQGTKTYYQYILLAGLIISNFAQVFMIPAAFSDAMMQEFGESFGLRQQMAIGSMGISMGLSGVTWLIGIATFVLSIICLNKIYSCYRPESATTWTVLSVIFPFLQPIYLFIIRNYAPDSEPDALQPPYYPNYGQPQNPYAPPYGAPPQNGAYAYPPSSEPGRGNYGQPPQMQQAPYQPPSAPEPPLEAWANENRPGQNPEPQPWENRGQDNR